MTQSQSRIDSIMESVVNVLIGLVISTAANLILLGLILHFPMSLGTNVLISSVFTVISLIRSYLIRRAFNGRSVWTALKDRFHAKFPDDQVPGLLDPRPADRLGGRQRLWLAPNDPAHFCSGSDKCLEHSYYAAQGTHRV